MISSKQADEILQELHQIRLLLERQQFGPKRAFDSGPTGSDVRIPVERDWYAIGRQDAPVTIVEFVDMVCPFCRRFHVMTFPEIKTEYIDTGKVRFVSRDLPLRIHPEAFEAAVAVRCAGDQQKFWQLHDAILTSEERPTLDVLLKQGNAVGLDMAAFQKCLKSDKYKGDVGRELQKYSELGIHSTPTFVIGRITGDWLDGQKVIGARSYDLYQRMIESALKTKTTDGAGTQRVNPAPEAHGDTN